MAVNVCMVSYHELGLKGKNRSEFERRLIDNINFRLVTITQSRAKKVAGRIVVTLDPSDDVTAVEQIIVALPGVTGIAHALRVPRDMDEAAAVALQLIESCGPISTFKVASKRSYTDFPLNSMEINQALGAHIVQHTGLGVRMKNPDATLSVLVSGGFMYLSARKVPGIGGLPSGSSGKVISLLSTGIDSPVATWRIIRRGAIAIGLHFSGRPATSDASERLVCEIGDVLANTGGLGRIYIVPFGDIQRAISSVVHPDLRIIIYRRVMMLVAEHIAQSENAKAIVTGESLGQVASQTLENIAAVDSVTTLPVFRPLIGNDKQEITNEAIRIGTYDLSIQDVSDCCTLFMPKNPETHAKPEHVAAAWQSLDIEGFVAQCLEQATTVEYVCNRYKPRKQTPTPSL